MSSRAVFLILALFAVAIFPPSPLSDGGNNDGKTWPSSARVANYGTIQWDTGDLDQVYVYRADVDDDGDVEGVLVSSYRDGSDNQHSFIRIISPSSTNQPNYEWTSPDLGVYTSLTINDIDDDGDQEMILRTYNGTGSVVQGDIRIIGGASHQTEWVSDNYGASVWGMEADVDGDGGLDMINIWTNSEGKYFEVLDGTTRAPIWDAINHSSNFNLVANDHDADGDIELVITEWNQSWVPGTSIPIYSSRITSYDGATLQEEWSTGWMDYISNAWFLDIDGDPQLEILEMRHSSVNGSTLYSFAVRDGQNMQEQWAVGPSESFIYANPAEVDASSPGMELIMKQGQKELEVRNSSDGQLLWNTTANQSIYGTAKDIDNDGWEELLVAIDGRVDIRNGTSYQLEWTTGYLGEKVTTHVYDVDNDNRLELILFAEPSSFMTEINVFDAEQRTLEWTSSLLTGTVYATMGGWGDFDGDSLIDGVFMRNWYSNSNQTQHSAAFMLEFADRNSAPNIILSTPNEGEAHMFGSAIQFDASQSSDPDGDRITFQWTSDIDGILSNLSAFTTSNLSLGTHQITLFAFDERGHEIWVNRTVIINEIPDEDGDGFGDGIDACTNTTINAVVDENGCAEYQLDDDQDGFTNDIDDCDDITGNATISPFIGCLDGDSDGYADMNDDFPNVSSQWHDGDSDGYGESALGFQPDACPDVYGNSTVDRFGCIDSDGDGWSDGDSEWEMIVGDDCENGADAFPNDPVQWCDGGADGETELVTDNNLSHNGTQPDNTTETDNGTSDLGEGLNQTIIQQEEESANVSSQNMNHTEQTEEESAEAELERAAENSEGRGVLFKYKFIIMGAIFAIAIIIVIILLIMEERGAGAGESYSQHLMSVASVPDTPLQQWTDEAGHTWRKSSEGRTQWWNGVDWQDI